MKIQNLFLTIVVAIFLNSCYNIKTDKKVYQTRAIELQNEGWSKKASEHIAKVESGLIPEDEEYKGYIED